MITISTDPAYHRIFDALSWSLGLGSGWIISRWRLRAARAAALQQPGYIVSLGAGAVVGAYLAGSFLTLSSGSLSHSIAGALAGAIATVEIYKAARGIRKSTGGVFVGPFVIGLIVGRWGCLFAGPRDGTYGSPTSMPWGVDLGDGVARHPVQIYESAAMLIFLVAYLTALARRAHWAIANGFYFMVIWYGAQRFVWEFLKPYPTLIGPLNLFHFICAGLVAYGCIWLTRTGHESGQGT